MFKLLRAYREELKSLPDPNNPTVTPAEIAAGMRTFADDIDAGDDWAIECAGPGGEMYITAEGWANYPTSWMRRVRIAYLGKTGPGEVPENVFDELTQRVAAEPGTTFVQF